MNLLRSWSTRELIILVGFILATLVLTYPLSLNPATMVPDPGDPLLSAWRLHWVGHTLLAGMDALSHLFDANIFYPYPLTLAYSEHFLGETLISLPLLWVTDSHLVGLNLSVMLSFVLTAYATYLFIADWSRIGEDSEYLWGAFITSQAAAAPGRAPGRPAGTTCPPTRPRRGNAGRQSPSPSPAAV